FIVTPSLISSSSGVTAAAESHSYGTPHSAKQPWPRRAGELNGRVGDEELGILAFARTPPDRRGRRAAVQHELAERIVERRFPDRFPAHRRRFDSGPLRESCEELRGDAGAGRLQDAPLLRRERIAEGRADDLVYAARLSGAEVDLVDRAAVNVAAEYENRRGWIGAFRAARDRP